MTKKTHVSWIAPLLIAAALLAVLWPLVRSGFYVSDDGEWMVIRLSAFYQSLAAGQFPVRFLDRLNNSYGYPVSNFLYPGFLYIGSVLRYLGMSFVDAVKLILAVSVIGSAAAIFIGLRSRFRTAGSVIGSVSFIFSPYLLYDLYHRGSVGEVLAMLAASLAVLSVMKGWIWLLAPSVTFLIVSHNTVALIAGMALFLLILAHKSRTNMMLSALLGVGMATFFWLPALMEKSLVLFDTVSVSNPSAYFIDVSRAVLLGFSPIIALLIILALPGKFKREDVIMMGCVIGGLFLSLPLSFPIWRIGFITSVVQFPYRFLVLPVLFGPWIVAAALERLRGVKLIFLVGIFVVLWIHGAVGQLSDIQFVDRNPGYYVTNEGTTTVANEYMPRWVSDIPHKRAVETLEVISGDATFSSRTFSGENIQVDIDAKETSIVQINKIYYPGWGVTIDTRLVPIEYHNDLGVMRVVVPQGTHVLAASFRETPFRFLTDAISVVCIIGYFVSLRRFRALS